MARAHTKQVAEESLESSKKRSIIKKKPDTGSWPCKINGCNKIFAREADLKRHQRTTKLHSMPSFACPQCEATFTRTDALRRHQKSRHNGVIIEPDQDKLKTSGDGEGVNHPPNPPQHHVLPPGPSHYYRSHTMPSGFPASVMMDPHYQPTTMIGLPTSATRGSWAPTWGEPPVYHVAPPGYFPSPYYRPTPDMMQHHVPPPRHVFIAQDPPHMHSLSETDQNSPGTSSSTPAPVIDPSLDSNAESSPSHSKSVSMKITEAAVQAVIESEKRREKEQEERDAAQQGDDDARDESEDNRGQEQMILDELLTQESLASP